jgi:hypothetical protein
MEQQFISKQRPPERPPGMDLYLGMFYISYNHKFMEKMYVHWKISYTNDI